jgi:hypothetical protein
LLDAAASLVREKISQAKETEATQRAQKTKVEFETLALSDHAREAVPLGNVECLW